MPSASSEFPDRNLDVLHQRVASGRPPTPEQRAEVHRLLDEANTVIYDIDDRVDLDHQPAREQGNFVLEAMWAGTAGMAATWKPERDGWRRDDSSLHPGIPNEAGRLDSWADIRRYVQATGWELYVREVGEKP
jgi:hypothetical protein